MPLHYFKKEDSRISNNTSFSKDIVRLQRRLFRPSGRQLGRRYRQMFFLTLTVYFLVLASYENLHLSYSLFELAVKKTTAVLAFQQKKSKSSWKPEPPSYLPLTQHLNSIRSRAHKPSLEDMTYGIQRKSQPDLPVSANSDIENCEPCVKNVERLNSGSFSMSQEIALAQHFIKLVTFYNISSVLMFPCIGDVNWLLPVTKKLKEWNTSFKSYCALPSEAVIIETIKNHGYDGYNGVRYIQYHPSKQRTLPQVGMIFSWRGLEQFNFDDIHDFFNDIGLSGSEYTLIGSSPGHQNARLVEDNEGILLVTKTYIPTLNVRAFPFGLNKPERIFSVGEKQLLFYNSSEMRNSWRDNTLMQ